jgi:hypothetical protein
MWGIFISTRLAGMGGRNKARAMISVNFFESAQHGVDGRVDSRDDLLTCAMSRRYEATNKLIILVVRYEFMACSKAH